MQLFTYCWCFLIQVVLPIDALSGDTYFQWFNQVQKHPSVNFHPSKVSADWYRDETLPTSLPKVPLVPYIGTLDLQQVPSALFPLEVTLFYDPLHAHLLHPQVGGAEDTPWDRPIGCLKFEQSIPSPYFVRIIHVSQSQKSVQIPVFVLGFASSPDTQKEPLVMALRLEIKDKNGNPFDRRLLIEAAHLYNFMNFSSMGVKAKTALVCDDPEADRFVHNLGLDSELLSRFEPLPGVLECYDQIGALWLDEATLSQSALTDQDYRRLLLRGVYLMGRAPVADKLASLTGTQMTAITLGAGIYRHILEHPYGWPAYGDRFASPKLYASKSAGLIEVATFMKDRMIALVDFTLWGLSISVVLIISALLVGFLLLRGEARLWIWIVVPALSLLTGLAGYFSSFQFLDDRTLVDLNMFTLSREGWSEAYRVSTWYTASEHKGLAVWKFPGRWSLSNRAPNSILNYGSKAFILADHRELEELPDHTIIRYDVRRGAPAMMVAENYSDQPVPCALAGPGMLRIQRGFKKALLWDGHQWLNLGALEAGQLITLETAHPSPPGGAFQGERKKNKAMEPCFLSDLQYFPEVVQMSSEQQWMNLPEWSSQGLFIGLEAKPLSVPEPLEAEKFSVTLHPFAVHQFMINTLPAAP